MWTIGKERWRELQKESKTTIMMSEKNAIIYTILKNAFTNIFKWTFLLGADNASSERQKPNIRHEKLSCWSRMSRELPKHTTYLHWPLLIPEVDSKSLLLKIPCISEIEPRVLWRGSDLGALSLRTFILQEDTIQISKARRQPTVLPNYDGSEPHHWPPRHANLMVQ